MLYDTENDPFELNNMAASRPELVASMSETLEAEFGGPGAMARIDAEQMANNIKVYHPRPTTTRPTTCPTTPYSVLNRVLFFRF